MTNLPEMCIFIDVIGMNIGGVMAARAERFGDFKGLETLFSVSEVESAVLLCWYIVRLFRYIVWR